jgi:hypothetical protein
MRVPLVLIAIVAFLVFDAVIIAVVVKARGRKQRDMRGHFQWLAERFGLAVAGGDPYFPAIKWLRFIKRSVRLEGSYRGMPVKVYHYTVSSGNSSTTYATARVYADNPKGLTLRFSREGLLSKVGKSLGMQDVQAGDARFDNLMVVKSSDPSFVASALLPEIKEKFYAVWETHRAKGSIRLKDEELQYDEVGTIGSQQVRDRFAAVVDLLADLGGIVKFYNR